MKIISNLPIIPEAEVISLALSGGAEPLKILKQELGKLSQIYNDAVLLLVVCFAGRRIIEQSNVLLVSGRRHRIYYALQKGSKIYIKYGWHKIKKLSSLEEKFVQEKWHTLFFEREGRHLIQKSGGHLYADPMLYTHCDIIFDKLLKLF